MTNLEIAIRFLEALSKGDTSIAELIHPDARQEELPNAFYPHGQVRNYEQMLSDFERGKKLLSTNRYRVLRSIVDGDRVALEVDWTGTLAVAAGTYPAGHTFHAQLGIFMELRDGRIISQRNYDCYFPAAA